MGAPVMPDGTQQVEATAADATSASITPAAASEHIRNLTETAAFFKRSVPTVREWIRAGAPVVEGGSPGVEYRLDLREVAEWLDARRADEAAAAAERQAADQQLAMELFGDDLLRPDGARDGLSPKAIRELADAQKHLMLVEQQRRNLVKADAMALTLSAAFRRLADRLAMLPDALQRDHGLAADAANAVAEAVDDALNDLADELERDAGADLAGIRPAYAEAAE